MNFVKNFRPALLLSTTLLYGSVCSIAVLQASDIKSEAEIKMSSKRFNTAKDELLFNAYGHLKARAIQIAADLKIADILHQQPMGVDDLANRLGAHVLNLKRLMMVLESHEVFKKNSDGTFYLTEQSEFLRSDHPQSLRAAVAKEMDSKRWESVGALDMAVKNGSTPFNILNGMGFYDYLEGNPKAHERFNAGMGNFSVVEDSEIPKCYDFSGARCVMDVGGSYGGFLATVLKENQSIQGILFDLPATVKAQTSLSPTTHQDRYKVVGGSFFDQIPEGADIHVMKRVFHNWSDENCHLILRNSAKALPKEGKVLIVDVVLEDSSKPNILKDGDLIMMSLGEGRERTREEFRLLLEGAGFTLNRILPTSTKLSIIEGIRQ